MFEETKARIELYEFLKDNLSVEIEESHREYSDGEPYRDIIVKLLLWNPIKGEREEISSDSFTVS